MRPEKLMQLLAEVRRWEQSCPDGFSLSALVEVFAQLSGYYRPSGKEDAALRWIVELACDQGLEHQFDAAGNLLVRVEGNQCSTTDVLILQAHVDMVCVAPSHYDWPSRGVELVLEGDWLRGEGTSLGADNGVGVAMMVLLMKLQRQLPHPPLELLFTVSEEVGLVGARSLDGRLLRGKTLLSLDGGESSSFIDGCAGGLACFLSAAVSRQSSAADQAWSLTLGGLAGGHSGLEIGRHHGNALLLLHRCWLLLQRELAGGALLLGAVAGRAGNVIPSEAQLDFGLRQSSTSSEKREWSAEQWNSALMTALQQLLGDEQQLHPQLEWQLQPLLSQDQPLPLSAESAQLLEALPLLPDGVFLYNRSRDLVELSANLAKLTLQEGRLELVNHLRYARSSQLPWLVARVEAVARLTGLQWEPGGEPYACWSPAKSSALREQVQQCYQRLFGQLPAVRATHGGLECGVIINRVQQQQGRVLDALTMGPTMQAIHSTQEQLYLPGWQHSARLLVELLRCRAVAPAHPC